MEDTMDDIDEEMMDSESESKYEEVPLTEPSKAAIHNKEGLLKKLEDIVWPENADWIHRLTTDYDLPADIDVNNDDLAREMSFYTQALDGTRQAFGKLQALGLPFLRPPDYYAKMVKSDSHMLKIKGKRLEEKKIEEAEERKKARESKIIAKEVQTQKNKERAKRKKEDIESVKKWRK
ncbi:uncharacterized protein A4U43_C03F17500 [Asparagus officinalis]|uniref:Uncharacterized protein n=1 Tax=Asparagus officinalis TaxID=4686 RepID=A0A5P1FAV7_ASPOF|nr:uncharacterized protein A4U43_C03F17500 [Asparagus officinalis]